MNKKEPCGSELSLHASLVPDLVGIAKGSKVELKITAKKIGVHTHSLGKINNQMVDVLIENVEYEGADDGEDQE